MTFRRRWMKRDRVHGEAISLGNRYDASTTTQSFLMLVAFCLGYIRSYRRFTCSIDCTFLVCGYEYLQLFSRPVFTTSPKDFVASTGVFLQGTLHPCTSNSNSLHFMMLEILKMNRGHVFKIKVFVPDAVRTDF